MTLRRINKSVKQLRNQVGVVTKGKQKKKVNNANSGFNIPLKLSPEMTNFTGWDAANLYSRTQVTRFICDYIKEHGLKDTSDGRRIVPDAKLAKLLNYNAADTSAPPLTYFHLQKMINPHFPPKKEKVAGAAKVAAAAPDATSAPAAAKSAGKAAKAK
jgi:chromatin remodeling complex protein RSC6